MKSKRPAVFQKYDGRCAYCGCELPKRWHVDHLVPKSTRCYGGCGTDNIDNLMPSCPRCNISKSTFTLEEWRNWLYKHVESLNKYNTPYKLVKSFGLVKETNAPIIFYFEQEQP